MSKIGSPRLGTLSDGEVAGIRRRLDVIAQRLFYQSAKIKPGLTYEQVNVMSTTINNEIKRLKMWMEEDWVELSRNAPNEDDYPF